MQHDPHAGAVIAQGNYDHVKELQAALRSRGVAAEIVRPPKEHCGT